jgi:hypothetical protein
VKYVAEQGIDAAAGLQRHLNGSLRDNDVALLDQSSELDGRMAGACVVLDLRIEVALATRSGSLDQLDPVPIGVPHEAQA